MNCSRWLNVRGDDRGDDGGRSLARRGRGGTNGRRRTIGVGCGNGTVGLVDVL